MVSEPVALYTFDDDNGSTTVTDVVGGHTGTLSSGVVATTAGPVGCGRAMSFADGRYFVVPHAPAWLLDSGSFDFWLSLTGAAADEEYGLVSRDALGASRAGHLSLHLSPEGWLVLRLQVTATSQAMRCFDRPLPVGRWFHVAASWGPPGLELYVDRVRATGTGSTSALGGGDCGGTTSVGIAGNSNPWVVGASSGLSGEGVATPVAWPLLGASIDHLRISAARLTF